MGRCNVLCALCVWVSGLVAAWLVFESWKERFCPPGWILVAPGLHFESFVSLGGEPEAPEARQSEKFEKVRKLKRLGSSTGSLFGHILTPLPPEIEPASVLLRSFVSFFSRAFLAAFRSRSLGEIVESRRRPMCVRDKTNNVFTRSAFSTRSLRKLIF